VSLLIIKLSFSSAISIYFVGCNSIFFISEDARTQCSNRRKWAMDECKKSGHHITQKLREEEKEFHILLEHGCSLVY